MTDEDKEKMDAYLKEISELTEEFGNLRDDPRPVAIKEEQHTRIANRMQTLVGLLTDLKH